jgi:hypothetical protein
LEKQVLSTSEARANFAEALETAQVGGAVIGFDRYGRTVAALVPVEAVYMLAGLDKSVPAPVRAAIKRQAKSFVETVPSRVSGRAGEGPKRAPDQAPPPRAHPRLSSFFYANAAAPRYKRAREDLRV